MIPVSSTLPLEKISKKAGFLKPLYEKYKQLVLKKYATSLPGVPSSVLADNYNGVLRNEAYLNYKTYSPTQVIKIGNALIWLKISNGLIIGDVADVTDDFDDTLNALIKLAAKLGLQQIHFQTSPGTRLHDLFAKRIKPISSFAVTFKIIGEDVPVNKIKFTFADIDIF